MLYDKAQFEVITLSPFSINIYSTVNLNPKLFLLMLIIWQWLTASHVFDLLSRPSKKKKIIKPSFQVVWIT